MYKGSNGWRACQTAPAVADVQDQRLERDVLIGPSPRGDRYGKVAKPQRKQDQEYRDQGARLA